MKIPCKKLRENAVLPTRGTALAAGVDLYALLPDGQESFRGRAKQKDNGED